MGWATRYIQDLKEGQVVSFRPQGNSMEGKIQSGALCIVEPIANRKLKVGDIVLCKVNNSQYLHLIRDIKNGQYQIGNNKGRINGWISIADIFGILVEVE